MSITYHHGVRVLVLVLLLSCSETSQTDDRYKQVAIDFAHKLVVRDSAGAHALLAKDLAGALPPAQLQAKFDELMKPVGSANSVLVTQTMTSWPDKQKADVGWAYVAIAGTIDGEGLTIIVTREGDALRVRQVEWGRPD